MALFETIVTVDAPLERVFELMLLPTTHARLSPPEAGLNFTSAPERLTLGSRMEFKVQAWGVVQHIVHEVVELDPPRLFTEKQVRGPLKMWVHEHRFALAPDGGTEVIDRITFEPPGGLIGLIVTEAKILDRLEEGFFHRHAELHKLLASGT